MERGFKILGELGQINDTSWKTMDHKIEIARIIKRRQFFDQFVGIHSCKNSKIKRLEKNACKERN